MWATEPHEGITGVTFDSDGYRLVGTLYLARGAGPKPTVLLLHGCPGLEKNLDLAARLRDQGWNALLFHYRGCWGSAGRYDLRTIPRDVTAAVDYLARCPLAARAGSPSRYVEVEGANHAFSWHRAELANVIAGWLGAAFGYRGVRG
jgi:pimeloyl-ACP methyl ester carboxylesterase